MSIKHTHSFRQSTDGIFRQKGAIMPKKTAKKSGKKSSSITIKKSCIALETLREKNPVLTSGQVEQKTIEFLLLNLGEPFTSYELHAVLGGNSDKIYRDFFRDECDLVTRMVKVNNGVVHYEPLGTSPSGNRYALVMGKRGQKHTYKLMEVQ